MNTVDQKVTGPSSQQLQPIKTCPSHSIATSQVTQKGLDKSSKAACSQRNHQVSANEGAAIPLFALETYTS